VHITEFPEPATLRFFEDTRTKNWDRLLAVREEVLKTLEPLRADKTIAANLEARVRLAATGELGALLEKYAKELPALFIISQVEVLNSGAGKTKSGELRIDAGRALGNKCERCWNYSVHVGESSEYPTVCERCVAALGEIEGDGGVLAGSAKH
jgi:isoleucyl-tRNA synthetase